MISKEETEFFRNQQKMQKINFLNEYSPENCISSKDNYNIEWRNWLLSINRYLSTSQWFPAAKISIILFSYLQTVGSWNDIVEIWRKLVSYDKLSEEEIKLKISLLHQLGIIISDQGDQNNAIEFHEKSLKLSKEYHLSQLVSENFYELGVNYLQIGRYNISKEYFEKAISTQETVTKLALYSSGQLSNILMLKGKIKTAIDQLKDDLEKWNQFSDESDRIMVHNTLHTLGRAYLLKKDYVAAKNVLKNSLRLKYLAGSPTNLEAHTKCLLAEAYIGSREFGKAEQLIVDCIKITKEVNDYRYLALAYKEFAIIKLYTGEFGLSDSLISMSFSSAKKISKHPS